MNTEDFNFSLPESLIAQSPLKERDACRLLCLDRNSGTVEHKVFRDILTLLKSGDRLVFNNTKVLPVRLHCKKPSGAKAEVFFLESQTDTVWKALVKPGRKLLRGAELIVGEKECEVKLIVDQVLTDGTRFIRLVPNGHIQSIPMLIERFGSIPLPPYIRREANNEDSDEYQTVYATQPGAVAAPTAGLHFTEDLINDLKKRGVAVSFVTLHVGIGTFLPVKVADPRAHQMHAERFEISHDAAREINTTIEVGGRIIAVGTTVVRILEHCAKVALPLTALQGETTLKILPPYTFSVVNALVTNFHLPMSTLLMLVSAFAGKENVLSAYKTAVEHEYRFFSYGDAMFLS